MNDNLNEIIELLTAAREHYRERGGAVDDYSDGDGHTCALGSLIQTSFDRHARMTARNAARQELASRVPGGTGSIAGYNDSFTDLGERRAAILDLYDATIKDLENE